MHLFPECKLSCLCKAPIPCCSARVFLLFPIVVVFNGVGPGAGPEKRDFVCRKFTGTVPLQEHENKAGKGKITSQVTKPKKEIWERGRKVRGGRGKRTEDKQGICRKCLALLEKKPIYKCK